MNKESEMLNGLLVAVFCVFVVLLAIKHGFLEIMAISLAIVALIPFAMSVFLYFWKAPVLQFQVASKSKQCEGKACEYKAMIVVMCEKGEILLEDFFVSSEHGVLPSGQVDFVGLFQESGMGPTVRLSNKTSPMFDKTGFGYQLQFRSEDEKEKLQLHFIANLTLDPHKLGILAILQPHYRYRYTKAIAVDFKNLDRQEGTFDRRK